MNFATKWRPRKFEDVAGQNLVKSMLKNALYLGKEFSCFVFYGKRGTGKTTMARILAAAMNCERLQEFKEDPKNYAVPCGECESCRLSFAGRHPDFAEIDAASNNGVEQVRSIIEAATLMPVRGRKKIFLLDEAHMLTRSAFNALLKLLEEPPEHVVIMLATTEVMKIPDTVLSRAFQIPVHSPTQEELKTFLISRLKEEGIEFEEKAVDEIASLSDSSVREAVVLLEQAILVGGDALTLEAVEQLTFADIRRKALRAFENAVAGNLPEAVKILGSVETEVELLNFWNELNKVAADLLMIAGGFREGVKDENRRRKLDEIVAVAGVPRIHAAGWLAIEHDRMFFVTHQRRTVIASFLHELSGQVRLVTGGARLQIPVSTGVENKGGAQNFAGDAVDSEALLAATPEASRAAVADERKSGRSRSNRVLLLDAAQVAEKVGQKLLAQMIRAGSVKEKGNEKIIVLPAGVSVVPAAERNRAFELIRKDLGVDVEVGGSIVAEKRFAEKKPAGDEAVSGRTRKENFRSSDVEEDVSGPATSGKSARSCRRRGLRRVSSGPATEEVDLSSPELDESVKKLKKIAEKIGAKIVRLRDK